MFPRGRPTSNYLFNNIALKKDDKASRPKDSHKGPEAKFNRYGWRKAFEQLLPLAGKICRIQDGKQFSSGLLKEDLHAFLGKENIGGIASWIEGVLVCECIQLHVGTLDIVMK